MITSRVCNWAALSDWHPVTCSARTVRIIRQINEQLCTAVVYLITISQSLSVTIRCNKPHHFRPSGCNISTFVNTTLTRWEQYDPFYLLASLKFRTVLTRSPMSDDSRVFAKISTISRLVDTARSISPKPWNRGLLSAIQTTHAATLTTVCINFHVTFGDKTRRSCCTSVAAAKLAPSRSTIDWLWLGLSAGCAAWSPAASELRWHLFIAINRNWFL